METVGAVVLAGRPNSGRLQAESNAENEALIEIAGRPMVEYVLAALRGCRQVGDMVLVGPPFLLESLARRYGARVVPPASDLLPNALAGMRALEGGGRFLLATSDIPLITGPIIGDFLAACRKREGEFYYPIVARDALRRYPQVQRTFAHLREGIFTGGNLFLIDRAAAERAVERADRIVALRKQPLRLAALVGPGFVWRFLRHRVTIPEAEAAFTRAFGVQGVAVPLAHPEIGIDVDKPSDLAMIRAVLS